MKKSKWETAVRLARGHFEVEPHLKRIFLLEPIKEQDPDEPIKLLEIVEGTIERGIEPIAFTSDPEHGIDYPSMIIEVSPGEFQHICNGEISLKDNGWMVGKELRAG
ncbi:hypothetical protein MHK_002398 [Candidatus Magnetomorum sp. HK-1]|nr:hypothetical protein MHK_002398 [Candidatus Magnetomorum sp. HK-1]